MQSSRTIVRVPLVCRVNRGIPTARSFHYIPTPFVPRFTNSFGFPTTSHDFGYPAISQDFAPLLKLLEDMTVATPVSHPAAPRPVIYQPRFDVREIDGRYELRGEIPGVEQQDLSVEFSDAQTLVIRGRTTRETSNKPKEVRVKAEAEQQFQERPSPDIAAVEPATAVEDKSDAMSTHSTGSYQKATVEDAIEDGANQAAPSSPGVATPTSSAADNSVTTANAMSQIIPESTSAPKQTQQQESTPSSQYWISERSVGEFQRTFNFSHRVDHDGVRATLRNGVLSIVVPKASRPVSRRIQIE